MFTCGWLALNGGMPTSNSYKIMPTDHQSAVVPAKDIKLNNGTSTEYFNHTNIWRLIKYWKKFYNGYQDNEPCPIPRSISGAK